MYKLLLWICTYLSSPHFSSIYREFWGFVLTWYSSVVGHLLWRWNDLWQPLNDWCNNDFECSSGCSLMHLMNSIGLSRDGRLEVCARQRLLMPQPPYLMLLGCSEHPFSAFRKVSVQGMREVHPVFQELTGLRFPQTDRSPSLLLRWSLGAFGPFWWTFPCHKGNQYWFLEKPTSFLNTKKVTYAPIPVISMFVNIDSSAGLIPTKYSLSSAFWMSFYKENNSSLSHTHTHIYIYIYIYIYCDKLLLVLNCFSLNERSRTWSLNLIL